MYQPPQHDPRRPRPATPPQWRQPAQPQFQPRPPQPQYQAPKPAPAPPRPPARPRRKPNWGLRVFIGIIAAGGLLGGLAEAFGSSSPPSPFQQCVTSIQQQGSGQVIGYTPQCMQLSVSDRQAAIKQALGDG